MYDAFLGHRTCEVMNVSWVGTSLTLGVGGVLPMSPHVPLIYLLHGVLASVRDLRVAGTGCRNYRRCASGRVSGSVDVLAWLPAAAALENL